jgi:D-tyrosyl-tRNA(Tyr) deacylase
MRAVIQRVRRASVTVEGHVSGAIEGGLLVLVAVAPEDDLGSVEWLSEKLVHLRIFADEEGKMNRSVIDLGLGVLVVSQFTLYGDCRRGRRPAFTGAAPPEVARPLVDRLSEALSEKGVVSVGRGIFGAHMEVSLVNDGPVTLILDSP